MSMTIVCQYAPPQGSCCRYRLFRVREFWEKVVSWGLLNYLTFFVFSFFLLYSMRNKRLHDAAIRYSRDAYMDFVISRIVSIFFIHLNYATMANKSKNISKKANESKLC